MALSIVASDQILQKLTEKHSVCLREVEQCFENRQAGFLQDDRENHATNPPTLWFVAPTNKDRILKIMFVLDDGNIYLKSAYEATPEIQRIYNKYAA